MTIFLEFHGNPQGVLGDLALAQELAAEHGASSFEASSDPAERAQLWEARHNMFYAMVAAYPGKRNVVTDVAVPISYLPEAVSKAVAWYAEAQLPAFVAGHVGDGNFHFIIFFDEGDAEAEARIAEVSHKMIQHALSVAGTSTGEHGVCIRKLRYMREEHGASLDVMIAIKRALDPKGIMNPGKKLPLS
jgi:D-lactate dehydrogenase (cytochrome)